MFLKQRVVLSSIGPFRTLVIIGLMVAVVCVSCGPSDEERAGTIEAGVAVAVQETFLALPTVTNSPSLTPNPTLTTVPANTPLATYTAFPSYTPLPTLTPNPTYTPFPSDTPTIVPTPTPGHTPQPIVVPLPVTDPFNARSVHIVINYMNAIYDIFRGRIEVTPWGEITFLDPAVDCYALLSTFDSYQASIPAPPTTSDAMHSYEVFMVGIATFEAPVIGWIDGCKADPSPRHPGNQKDHIYLTTQEAIGYLNEAVRILEEI